jgi:hypothetical protein
VGVVRSKADASNTTLHACSVAPCEHFQPRENHQVCVWSHGVRNTTPYDANTSLLPGVAEGALHLHNLETMRDQFASRHHLTRVFDTVKTRTARAASDGSLDVTLTGIARGILVIRARLVVGDSHVKAGEAVADQIVAARQEVGERSKGMQSSDFESCSLLAQEPLTGIAEPYATPSNNLALALQVNEQARVLMKNKSHRGDPCRHLVGAVTMAEMQEACVEEYDKPQTLLPIVDCKVDFLEDPTLPGERLPNRRDATLRRVAITLTVCGDSPVRLPELLDVYGIDVRSCETHETNRFFQLLALTWAGAARASELNDVAASITAGHVNSSIASAKRILVGDLNLRTWLTLYQVYRVGTSNVPRSHETTPWSGTCGAGFDIGTSGGIGIRASSITADKRSAPSPARLGPRRPFTASLLAQEPRQDPHVAGAGGRVVEQVCRAALCQGQRPRVRRHPARGARGSALHRARAARLPQRLRRRDGARAYAARHHEQAHRRLAAVPALWPLCGAAGAPCCGGKW